MLEKYERRYSIIQPKVVKNITDESAALMMNDSYYHHQHQKQQLYSDKYSSIIYSILTNCDNQHFTPSSILETTPSSPPLIMAKFHYLGNINQIPFKYTNSNNNNENRSCLLKTSSSSSPFIKVETLSASPSFSKKEEKEEGEREFVENYIHSYDGLLSASASSSSLSTSSSSSSFLALAKKENNFNQLYHFLHSDVDTLLETAI